MEYDFKQIRHKILDFGSLRIHEVVNARHP